MGGQSIPRRFHALHRRLQGWIPATQDTPVVGAVQGIVLRSSSLPSDGSPVLATLARPGASWVLSYRTPEPTTYDASLPANATGLLVVRYHCAQYPEPWVVEGVVWWWLSQWL